MKNHIHALVLAAVVTLGMGLPAYADYNTYSVVGIGSISSMQSLGMVSGTQIPVVQVFGSQGDGSQFAWVSSPPPTSCNPITGEIDGGTTFCASDGSGGWRTDGYWQRQGTGAVVKDVWFGIVRDNTTDNTAAFPKWLAACSGKTMLDTTGTALYSTVGSTSYTPPVNCTWQTVAGSNDSFTVNTSSTVLLSQTNANFSIGGFGTITFNVPATGFSDFIEWRANNLSLKDVTINGGMADNGTTITTGRSRLIYVKGSSATGLTIRDVMAPNFHSGYSKLGFSGGCDSSTQSVIRIDHLVMTNIYAFGLNFNSPCGSQNNIKVTDSSFSSAAPAPLAAVSSAPIGIGFASGKDILVQGNTVTGAWLDFLHLEQDVQNFRIVENHCELPSGVTALVGRCLDIVPANIQNGGVFLHPAHGEIAHNIANLLGTTTGSTAMAFGTWINAATTSDVTAEDVDFHDNQAIGAWPYGFYDQATGISRTVSFHGNICDGGTNCYFVYRGGTGVYDNVSKNCTVGILYTIAYVRSHIFNNCTQTVAGSTSTSLITIPTLQFDYPSVSVTGGGGTSPAIEMLDLDATNARLSGTMTVQTVSTDGTSRNFTYYGAANNQLWDGTNWADAGTLHTLNFLQTASGAASTFSHGTSGCAWGSSTSCLNFSFTNNNAAVQSLSATATITGGAYQRKGM